MADGFRITEAGDPRVTSSDDTRITENLVEGHASLSSTGSQLSAAVVGPSIYLEATGTATFNGIRIKNAASSLSSSGTFNNSDIDLILSGILNTGTEDLTRITEAGDTRIDESGNIRIVTEVSQGEGFLEADCTQIFFSSVAYIHYDGEWRTFTPTVKQDGTWDDPIAIYKKIDANTWKRAY